MSEENVNIMRQGYDAFNRGDIDAVMGLMDPEIEWQEPDVKGSPVRGTHHSPEAVANNVFGRWRSIGTSSKPWRRSFWTRATGWSCWATSESRARRPAR